ncbi:MAG TPA: hypothetical protein VED40_08690 [Azospirillaceae bacterium]|nr:hypothetical protein [Azospirillaceae bacterium]
MTTHHNIVAPAGKAALRITGTRVAPLLGLALLALAGCGTDDGFVAGCPNVAVVRDAGTFVAGDAGGQLAHKATMTGFGGTCEYDETGVTVRADLAIRAQSGPAFAGGAASYEYFVAVTDADRNVLAKQVFATSVNLAGGTGTVTERLVQFIPLPPTVDGRYYEVLAGFQLTPDQVEANRRMNEGR